MTFSNPAGGAREAAGQYTTALLAVLDGREPLDLLPLMPANLRTLAESVDDAKLRRPEKEGKWSMIQIAQHLADTELVVGWRYRMAVSHDEPPVQPFDQDRFVSKLWKGDESLEDVLSQFEALRAINLRFLRSLTPEEWQRGGLHAERGRETVRRNAELSAAHDLVHLRQMGRVKQSGK